MVRRSGGIKKIVADSAFLRLAPHRGIERAAAAVHVRALRCSPRPSTGENGFFVGHGTAQLEVGHCGTRLATHTSYTLPAQSLCYHDFTSMARRMRTYLIDNLLAADSHVRANSSAHVHCVYPYPFQSHPHVCPRLLCAGQHRPFRAAIAFLTSSSRRIGEIAASVRTMAMFVCKHKGRSESSSLELTLAACS